MSPHKRLLLLFAFMFVVLVSSATTTEAQGFRRGYGSRVVIVGGGYYSPFYDPFWYGDPWYGYQYPWRPYPPPYRYYGYSEASVRLDVKPKEAEV